MPLGFGQKKTALTAAIKVSSLLDAKGREVFALSPRDTVYDAIAMMSEKHVGALLVMEGEALVGIISERDYARKVILCGRSSKDTPIAEIMSAPVIFVSPDATVDECMRIMTEQRVRHLPVVDNGRVVGVISIGDLVRVIISEQAQTIDHLHAYIHGSYPA